MRTRREISREHNELIWKRFPAPGSLAFYFKKFNLFYRRLKCAIHVYIIPCNWSRAWEFAKSQIKE